MKEIISNTGILVNLILIILYIRFIITKKLPLNIMFYGCFIMTFVSISTCISMFLKSEYTLAIVWIGCILMWAYNTYNYNKLRKCG